MSLDRIIKRYKNNNKEVKGFKVVRREGGGIYSADMGTPLAVREWNKPYAPECHGTIEMPDESTYRGGYHIWRDIDAANPLTNEEVIVYCSGKGVILRGQEKGNEVYVCRELFIWCIVNFVGF